MKKSLAIVALTALWVLKALGQDIAPPKTLTQEDALRLALERNPQLRAAHFGVQSAEGLRLQAGAIPNPTLSVEAENFGGDEEARGFDSVQTTIGLEQTLEWGGKRGARKRVATAEMKLAEWERDATRLDVINETTDRFIDALAAQEELTLSQDAWQTAESIYQVVSNRVTAGKDSPVEEAKSRAELALAKLAVERAKARVTVSRTALCAMWADSAPDFASVRGDLAKVAETIPPVAALHEAMTRSPGWARWTDEIQSSEWALRVERRSRIPDLTIGGGISQSRADDSQTFVASVGMELPLFDRKRGNVLTAKAELNRKRAEQDGTQIALRTELTEMRELLSAMQKEAITIAQDALPAAEQAFAAAQASHASGKIGYLDIQDARRSLIEMRRQQIETLADYHRAVAQMERLTGVSLSRVEQK